MKQLIKPIFAIFAIILFIAGCVKEDFDITPQKIYNLDFVETTTIAELKAMFPALEVIEDDIIIKGTVISSDSLGNFYEKLVIQDSTGGIEIQIDKANLYRSFKIGRMVYVKCKGLVIGDYAGVKQLTYFSNGSSVKLPEAVINDYLFRSEEGLPIKPKTVNISDLNKDFINTLIKVENVRFSDGEVGLTFATPTADANRTLLDVNDNELKVRTSRYATFASDTVPGGVGSIIGVYSVFNNDKQLYMRDIAELDMEGSSLNYILNENFSVDLGNFTNYSVLGTYTWIYGTYGAETFAKASGFNNGINEDWLFTPSLDLSSYTIATLNFRHAVGYFTTWSDMTVWISTNYDGVSDPNVSGSWTQITGFNQPVPSGTFSAFESSGDLDLTSYVGNSSVYIAFKYICTASAASTWEVATVKVIAQ